MSGEPASEETVHGAASPAPPALPTPPVAPLSAEAASLRASLSASDSAELAGVVRTDDFYRVRFLLSRYVGARGAPRSVLVEGYRGAGKSTFTRTLIEDVWRAQIIAGSSDEPLPIILDAPAMLTQELPERHASGDTRRDDQLRVLAHVAAQLAAGVEKRFLEAFLRRSTTRDLSELYARLQLELRGAPSPELLLEVWGRYGAMETGVLSRSAPVHTPGLQTSTRAVDEMMLLHSTVAILQRLTTTGSQRFSANRDASESRSVEERFSLDPTRLTAAIASGSVLGGLAAGVVGDAVVTGFAAIAGTVTGWNSSSRRDASVRAQSSFQQELQIDMSIASLLRLIPELVRRMRALGMAPVFIVDELDKLEVGPQAETEDASQRVQLFQALKAFINDDAFFFFLDHPRRRPHHTQGYSVESTLWQDRVLLAYEPNEVAEALMQVVRGPEGTAVPKKMAHAVLVAAFDGGNHLYTSLRRLESLVSYDNEGRRLDLDTGLGRGATVRTFQLIVMEWFQSREVQSYIDKRRERVMWLLDAVHWLTTQWRDAESRLKSEQADPADITFTDASPPDAPPDAVQKSTREAMREHILGRRLTQADLPRELSDLGIDRADETGGLAMLERLCIALTLPFEADETRSVSPTSLSPASFELDPTKRILEGSNGEFRFRVGMDGVPLRDPGHVRSREAAADEALAKETALFRVYGEVLSTLLDADFSTLARIGVMEDDVQKTYDFLIRPEMTSGTVSPADIQEASRQLAQRSSRIRAALMLGAVCRRQLALSADATHLALEQTPRSQFTEAMVDAVLQHLDLQVRPPPTSARPDALGRWATAVKEQLPQRQAPPVTMLDGAIEHSQLLLQGAFTEGGDAARWLANAVSEHALALTAETLGGASVSAFTDRLLVHFRGRTITRPRALQFATEWLGIPAEVIGEEMRQDDVVGGHLLEGAGWLQAAPAPSARSHPSVLAIGPADSPCHARLPFRTREESITVVSVDVDAEHWRAAAARWTARLELTHVIVDLEDMKNPRALTERIDDVRRSVGPTARLVAIAPDKHFESIRDHLGNSAAVVLRPVNLPALIDTLKGASIL